MAWPLSVWSMGSSCPPKVTARGGRVVLRRHVEAFERLGYHTEAREVADLLATLDGPTGGHFMIVQVVSSDTANATPPPVPLRRWEHS